MLVQDEYGGCVMAVIIDNFSTWTFKSLDLFLDHMGKEGNRSIMLIGFLRAMYYRQSLSSCRQFYNSASLKETTKGHCIFFASVFCR